MRNSLFLKHINLHHSEGGALLPEAISYAMYVIYKIASSAFTSLRFVQASSQ